MKTIWGKGLQKEKNINLAFTLSTKTTSKNVEISLIAINAYRLFVNNKLIGYGPARACHGYVRKDNYELSPYINDGNLIVVVEVFGSNVNSYYFADEPPFFGAELSIDGKRQFSTANGDFSAHLLTDRVVKVQRYDFQRPFSECYIMEKCRSNFYKGDFSLFPVVEIEFVKNNKILERYAPYPLLETIDHVGMVEKGKLSISQDLPKWEDRSMHTDNILRGYKKSELDVCASDEVSAFTYQSDKNREISNYSNSSNFDQINYSNTPFGILIENSYHVYDFGRTITGFFNIKLNATRNVTFYIIWDEIDWNEDNIENKPEMNICFYRNACCNIIKYTLKAGEYDLLSFEPTSARYAKIIVTSGEVEIIGFEMVSYENPTIFALDYISDDPKLNAIVIAAQNTLAQNSVDVLTDCPSRERAGWLCDSYFSAKAEKLMSGHNNVERSFVENFVLAPQLKDLPEGMFPMCYPSDHYDGNYIPNWAMWFVVELKDYLKRTGDIKLVEQSKEKIYKLIEYFEKYINNDGLLEDLEGWIFVEWSMSNDPEFIKGVNYPSNMLFYRMLKNAGELYNDEVLILRAEFIKNKILEQSYNGEFFEDNHIHENGHLVSKNHTTETCQYYAFFCDVATKETFPVLYKTLLESFGPFRDEKLVYPEVHKSNAFIGNYLRLEILMRDRLGEQVLSECKEFFYFMAQRTGTLWEHSYPYGSLNHGFASVAANYIIECTTGLADIDFSNKTVTVITPVKGFFVNAKVPTPDGFIEISSNNGDIDFCLPEGYKLIR